VLNLKIASVYHTHKKDNMAYPLIVESLALSKKLSNKYPKNKLFKRDVVSSYESLADLYKDNDDYNKALINYNKALSISKILLNSDKDSTDYQKLNIIFLQKIASTYSRISAVSIAINLIDNYEKKDLPQDMLKAFENKTKGIKRSCGNKNCLDMAIESHIKELQLSKKLSESNPNNNIFYKDLVNVYNSIAVAYIAKNDLNNASIYYSKFIEGSKEVLRRNPLHIHHKFQLAKAYDGLADISRRKKKFKKAKELYNESISLMEDIIKTNPNNQSWKQYLRGLKMMKNGLDVSEKADLLINKGINKF